MLYWSIFMQCLQTCYVQPNLIWPIWWMPLTLTSSYQTPHGPFTLPTIQFKCLTRCSNIWTRHAFCILFIDDSKKIGKHRQWLTDLNTAHENKRGIDYDYKVGQKVLLRKEGILCNAESRWHKKPWLITSVHTNGTIMVQCGNKIDRMNIRRVKPFEEDLHNE